MIDINEFQNIRKSQHLIVLDTNIILELSRQPANISLDVINALKKIKDCIFIPRQVYDEYIRNYHEICGKERKKYQKVKKELSESTRKLQEDIDSKISEYRKHNYTDITKLQNDLYQKIKEIQNTINNFEHGHKTEIQLNIDFLENDKVKEFVDFLEAEERIGADISFSTRLSILQEGKIRFDNLIPPGYMDREKIGQDKYGDLFVWKSILAIAKEKNTNIIFVCNDTKEDWWKKDKEIPVNLRDELLKEFKEVNPFLDIQFLTLEKFFSYIAEELQIGKSKSALQLSAIDDAKILLNEYSTMIEQNIEEVLCSINIEEELGEEYLETGEEQIYWNIGDVSVEKEEHDILYYVDLDISVLADLVYREPGDYPYPAGKVVLALEGKINFLTEEYASESTIESLEVELIDIYHMEPDEWKTVKNICKGESGKELIAASRQIKKYNENMKKIEESLGGIQNISGTVYGLQELAKPIQGISTKFPSKEMIDTIQTLSKGVEQFGGISKMAEQIRIASSTIKPLGQIAKTIEPISKQDDDLP